MTRGGSTNTADSFEDEAIDDAANRALLCEVGTDQAVRGSAPCTISSRRSTPLVSRPGSLVLS